MEFYCSILWLMRVAPVFASRLVFRLKEERKTSCFLKAKYFFSPILIEPRCEFLIIFRDLFPFTTVEGHKDVARWFFSLILTLRKRKTEIFYASKFKKQTEERKKNPTHRRLRTKCASLWFIELLLLYSDLLICSKQAGACQLINIFSFLWIFWPRFIVEQLEQTMSFQFKKYFSLHQCVGIFHLHNAFKAAVQVPRRGKFSEFLKASLQFFSINFSSMSACIDFHSSSSSTFCFCHDVPEKKSSPEKNVSRRATDTQANESFPNFCDFFLPIHLRLNVFHSLRWKFFCCTSENSFVFLESTNTS